MGKRNDSTFDNTELNQEQMGFLTHVAEKAFLFHSDRYESLGFSGSKGNGIKKDLVREGFLKETEINTGKRGANPKIVGLTKKAKRVIKEKGIEINERGKGGLEHRFWQQKIAEFYREKGYEVKIEHEINGKSIDVFAENEKKIGIEVAMSAKGEVDNIEKELKLGLDQLIVACKNERIMSDIGMKAKDTIGREKIREVKFQVVADILALN